jgi:hypothetical protein
VTADAVARHIEAAFADVPRPPNDLLLHPQSFDDSDIAALYEIDDWRSLPDDLVVSEYAALSFLSADGFRHFIPAYMLWVLRHPGAADAVVDSTIWALSPESYADPAIRDYARSKLTGFDDAQRAPSSPSSRRSRPPTRPSPRMPSERWPTGTASELRHAPIRCPAERHGAGAPSGLQNRQAVVARRLVGSIPAPLRSWEKYATAAESLQKSSEIRRPVPT